MRFDELEALAGTLPIHTHDNGRSITARIQIPQTTGPDLVYRVVVDYAPVGVGWKWGKKMFRKAKRLAKKVAKNKLVKTIAKTAPIWLNAVPPPAGPAMAAGVAAGQAAYKIARAAKRGHKAAKQFVKSAKRKVRKKKRVIRAGRTIARRLKKRPAKKRRVLRTLAARTGTYPVRTPSGRTVKVPASRL